MKNFDFSSCATTGSILVDIDIIVVELSFVQRN